MSDLPLATVRIKTIGVDQAFQLDRTEEIVSCTNNGDGRVTLVIVDRAQPRRKGST